MTRANNSNRAFGFGSLVRFAKACWEANQSAYILSVTDERGRVVPAVERQVALMMLG